METKTLSNHTFSNNSLQNWQSKRCDFCMYHELIFDQLQRLKEAVIIKNNRIKQLEQFIAKISQMAFLKTPPPSNSTTALTNLVSPKANDQVFQIQNELSKNYQKGSNAQYFKKKFEESSEISFSESKQNTAKFESKIKQKQNVNDISSRFQKINQLNQMKKQLHKKMLETCNKQSSKASKNIESFDNSHQFDTLRSLSQPQQQGHINSIAVSSCQNSRVSEFNQRKMNFQISMQNQQRNKQIIMQSQSKKDLNEYKKDFKQQSKISIDIIKKYIKKLK